MEQVSSLTIDESNPRDVCQILRACVKLERGCQAPSWAIEAALLTIRNDSWVSELLLGRSERSVVRRPVDLIIMKLASKSCVGRWRGFVAREPRCSRQCMKLSIVNGS